MTYDSLKYGSKYRLQQKRRYLAERQAGKNGHNWAENTWRDCPYIASVSLDWCGTWSRAIGGDFVGAYNVDNFNCTPFNLEGDADHILRLGHSGWYCDDNQFETIQGVVLSYHRKNEKTKKRELVFIPAVQWSDRDGVTIWPNEIYNEKEDAARAADSYAESIAEEEREYSEADYLALQSAEFVQETIETIKQARSEFHTLAADYRKSLLSGSVCNLLKRELLRLRKVVHNGVIELRDLREKAIDAQNELARLDRAIAKNYPQQLGA